MQSTRLALASLAVAAGALGCGETNSMTRDGGGPGSGGTGVMTGGSGGMGPGQIVFNGDFETGDLSQWNYIERCANDRITVYGADNLPAGAPAPRQGQYAARFHVLDTDVAPCTSTDNPRAELESREELLKPGDERWQFWSMYVPSTIPALLCGSCRDFGFFVIQEDYGPPWDGSPAIGWNVDFTASPNTFRIDRGEQYNHDQPGIMPLTKGRWVDLLVHKKYANTASGGGFVEAWVDGTPVTFSAPDCDSCTRLMTQTMHSTQQSLGFYLTAYRQRGYFAAFDVYYDAVRIGTTRESVELPR